MAKKSWSDLSDRQRAAVLVGAGIEIALSTMVLVDLARRPGTEVRGPKAVWVLSLVVQPFGPLAYLGFGRRPSAL